MTTDQQRERAIRQTIREAVKQRDFHSALAAAGRNCGPVLLFQWVGRPGLSTEELAELLPVVWQMAEWPERSLGVEMWLRLFRRAGFVCDQPERVMAPRDTMSVYRGCTPQRLSGMAWTTDRAKAEWFAARDRDLFGHGDADVYSATIQPDGVLALIFDREESEVVVDPRRLVVSAE